MEAGTPTTACCPGKAGLAGTFPAKDGGMWTFFAIIRNFFHFFNFLSVIQDETS